MEFNKAKSISEQLPHHSKLPDLHQSWWQLAAIQLTGFTSLPILIGSILIIQNSNFKSAIITLALANVILWAIRLVIILMSVEGRKSALDITHDYFGTFGSFFIAVLLLASTLVWFIIQTTLASNALNYLIPIEKSVQINRFMQIGVLIGILSTLLCMNGIKVIKWASIISLPILLIAFIAIIFVSHPEIPTRTQTGISISGLPIILGTSLGITIDMPTFFRHSRSKKDSLHALTTIQLISFAVGLGGIFFGSIIEPWIGLQTSNTLILNDFWLKNSLIIFIFFSVICANISNVYSSSVGWELIAPVLAGKKEYLILGLGLTIFFIIIANVFSLELLSNITDSALVNLSFVFVFAYLKYLIVKSYPSNVEKFVYFSAWLFSTTINVLQFFNVILQKISSLIIGCSSVLLIISIFLLISFLIKRKNNNGNLQKQ